jgi:hypothetical protein
MALSECEITGIHKILRVRLVNEGVVAVVLAADNLLDTDQRPVWRAFSSTTICGKH